MLKNIRVFISQMFFYSCSYLFSLTPKTSRHLSTRIKEHLASDKNSHTFKHLSKNSNCKNNTSPTGFKIIDSDKSFPQT